MIIVSFVRQTLPIFYVPQRHSSASVGSVYFEVQHLVGYLQHPVLFLMVLFLLSKL